MLYETTKKASQETGIAYFCLSDPCGAESSNWLYRGVTGVDKKYLVVQEHCLSCDTGKLTTIPLERNNYFEQAVELITNKVYSSSAELIKAFNALAYDFDHTHAEPALLHGGNEHLVLKTAYLWLDDFESESNDIDSDSGMQLAQQDLGIFAFFEKRAWWLGYVPLGFYGPSTKKCFQNVFHTLERRYEEALMYGADNYLSFNVALTVDSLEHLNNRMYFNVGSCFTDLQMAISSELRWKKNGYESDLTLTDIHECLSVMSKYKNYTISGNSEFQKTFTMTN